MQRRAFLRLAAAAMVVPALPSHAGEYVRPLGVVELFTSQGCASCPRADAYFAELAQRNDVVALAFHVDYWNYLGWRDQFSLPESTARQYAYMRSFKASSVYTPQMIVNGRVSFHRKTEGSVTEAMESMRKRNEGLPIGIKVSRSSESVVIDADAGTARDGGGAHVVLVYFAPPQPVVIDNGENKGKTVTYWNAVTDIQTAGMWHGEKQRYELPMSEISKKQGGCAVLLQQVDKDGQPGPILGAAIVRRPEMVSAR